MAAKAWQRQWLQHSQLHHHSEFQVHKRQCITATTVVRSESLWAFPDTVNNSWSKHSNQWSQWEHKNHMTIYYQVSFNRIVIQLMVGAQHSVKQISVPFEPLGAMYTIQKIMNCTISWAYVLHIHFKYGLSMYTQNAHTNSTSAYATWKIWTKLKLTISRPFLYAVRFNYYTHNLFSQ